MRPARLAGLGLSLLVGCTTTYRPLAGNMGYSVVQLNERTFRVSFRGNPSVAEDMAYDYTLLRSAEVALEHGFRYFAVTDSRTEAIQDQNFLQALLNPVLNVATMGGLTEHERQQQIHDAAVGNRPSPPLQVTTLVVCSDTAHDDFFDCALIAQSLRTKYALGEE